jgi:8-oxo-dGTP pyrophosphatase MutT (NUDIX family)
MTRIDAELIAAALGGSSFRAARPGPMLARIRPAAVVVPIRFGAEPSVSFVLRARHLNEHAGEVAFPGGKPEPGEALLDTALREAEEEVGLSRDQLRELGTLTPVPVITGLHLIHPFVMAVSEHASPRAASGEVERVLVAPLGAWIDGRRRYATFPSEWRGNRFPMPQFEIEGALLFGATALIFHELLTRIADHLGVALPEPEQAARAPWER